MAAQVTASAFIEQMATVFGRYDLLATPTTAILAFSTDLAWGPDEVSGQVIDAHLGWIFTWPFNLTGHPIISLPCGWSSEGMPYGLPLVGRRRADGLVLRVAAAIETAAESMLKNLWEGGQSCLAAGIFNFSASGRLQSKSRFQEHNRTPAAATGSERC